MKNLNEAIRYQELKGVVCPEISIDEFEPKTGDESDVIVVALFCKEEEAANDLRDFLEKGVVDTLDIDTSPASDENGRYLVFIEFKRDTRFWNDLNEIIDDALRLSGDLDWTVTTYLNNRPFKLDDPELRNYVILDPESYMSKEEFQESLKGSINKFFDDSEIDKVDIGEGLVTMHNGRYSMSFLYEGVGDCDYTGGFEYNRVPSEVIKLRKLLGNSFSVNYKSNKLYVENLKNGSVLTLKLYE